MNAKEYKKALIDCALGVSLSDDWKKLSKDSAIKRLKSFQKVTMQYMCNTKDNEGQRKLCKQGIDLFCTMILKLVTQENVNLEQLTGYEVFSVCLFLYENVDPWSHKFLDKIGVYWNNTDCFLDLLRMKETYKLTESGEFEDADAEYRFEQMFYGAEILEALHKDFPYMSLVSEEDYIHYYLEGVYIQLEYRIGYLGQYSLYLVNMQNRRNIPNSLKFDTDVGFRLVNTKTNNALKVRTYADLRRILSNV